MCWAMLQCCDATMLRCYNATMLQCYDATMLRCAGRCYRPPLYACYRPTKDAHLSRVEEPPFFSIFSTLTFPLLLIILAFICFVYLIHIWLPFSPLICSLSHLSLSHPFIHPSYLLSFLLASLFIPECFLYITTTSLI